MIFRTLCSLQAELLVNYTCETIYRIKPREFSFKKKNADSGSVANFQAGKI